MYLLTVSVLGYLTTKCIISMPFSVLLIVFTDLSTEQVLENLWSPRSWETQASSSGAVQRTCQVRYLINTGDWALPDVYRNNGLYHLFDTVTFSRVIRIVAVFLYTRFQVFYDIDSFLQREFTIHLQVILGLCMCPEVPGNLSVCPFRAYYFSLICQVRLKLNPWSVCVCVCFGRGV